MHIRACTVCWVLQGKEPWENEAAFIFYSVNFGQHLMNQKRWTKTKIVTNIEREYRLNQCVAQ